MKILFVTSGYNGIYDYFEEWIQTELKKIHEIKSFDFKHGLSSLEALVYSFKPDVALSLVGFRIPDAMLHWLKQQKIKTAVWLTEDPYYMDYTLGLVDYFDFVFTIDSAALEYYKKKGHKHAYHLPLATNSEVFQPKQVEEKYRSDICLVGYPYPDRIKYVQLLLKYTSYKILLVGEWKTFVRKFSRKENLQVHDGWVDPLIVANYYNNAKIVLNTHRPQNLIHNQNKLGVIGKSINNRTFDVSACAAFQLIEYKVDLPLCFNEGEEIISFKSMGELIEKTNYYMTADEERRNIAIRARNRVLRDHTFSHRLDKMIAHIESSS